jgi:putative hemolysin
MNEMFFEIGLVLILILLNGFFAGAEMALISIRKTRIQQLVKAGNKKAILAEKILKKPEEFLATIQIGITLIGTIASAFAGANITEALSILLKTTSLSIIVTNSEAIAFVIVVIGITYFSLVLGELIPKSLGIKYSEKFSLFVIYPIYFLSRIFLPITKFLTGSSNLVLRIFGDKTSFSESHLTEEELRTLLYEGRKAGTLEKHEHEILDNVFDFSDIAAGQIMTPCSKIFAVDISDPIDKNINAIIDSGYSRIPVFKDNIDHILGIIHIKDLLKELQNNKTIKSLEGLINKAYFIPNTQHLSDLLKKFQKGKVHMAVVTNEYGDVDGILTIEDILEEIVGDIADESDSEDVLIHKQKDGKFQVDGSVSIVDFNRYFRTELLEDQSYTTVSGLLLDKFEKSPAEGTKTVIDNIEFTVKEKNDRMIKLLLVRKLPQK